MIAAPASARASRPSKEAPNLVVAVRERAIVLVDGGLPEAPRRVVRVRVVRAAVVEEEEVRGRPLFLFGPRDVAERGVRGLGRGDGQVRLPLVGGPRRLPESEARPHATDVLQHVGDGVSDAVVADLAEAGREGLHGRARVKPMSFPPPRTWGNCDTSRPVNIVAIAKRVLGADV